MFFSPPPPPDIQKDRPKKIIRSPSQTSDSRSQNYPRKGGKQPSTGFLWRLCTVSTLRFPEIVSQFPAKLLAHCRCIHTR